MGEGLKRAFNYVAWCRDSERRYKLGQRQRQCTCHGLWFWKYESKGHTFKPSNREATK